MESRYKLFSDPVHGFVSVPKRLLLELVQTPEVQRLRRIRQLGVGHLVFPGAEHTRFNHALGAMALMHDALGVLAEKGTAISPEEHQAALAAALLHDLGHGPFSHTLEHVLIAGFHHEAMSRAFLVHLNERFGGALDLTLAMFDDAYARPFFHELVASQLDMDRLDYLRRDSFYTGVVEGRVGVERIIKTLRVHPVAGGPEARVVIEAKGTHAVENFLVARQLMYWQVYLHKTVLAGDQLLASIFRRARRHLRHGAVDRVAGCSPDLLFFLQHTITRDDLARPDVRDAYRGLDDTDVLYSLKQWMRSRDRLLADLSARFIHRAFFRATFLPALPSDATVAAWRDVVAAWLVRQGLSDRLHAPHDATYYLAVDHSRHAAYERRKGSICILERDGRVRELSEASDALSIKGLPQSVQKPYVCYPKPVALDVEES